MIEAAEYATPTQLQLYRRYRDIHRKFFPSPPPIVRKPPEPAAALTIEIIAPQPEPIPEPAQIDRPRITLDQTNLRLGLIKEAVIAEFNISKEALQSDRRTKVVVLPRQMFCYLAQKLTTASLPRMGKALGGRDHTTVLHGIRRMKARVRIDRAAFEQAMRLEAALRQQFGDSNPPRHCIGRYVVHGRVLDYFMLGWMWAANINEYAALMIWPCGCQCVEPRDG